MNIEKLDFKKGNGLIPAIVQDYKNNEVLMLAYVNKESMKKTIETGETWFFSRSRKMLWHKGETSENVQTIKEIKVDCDNDTVLFLVKQKGAACHTGEKSCFYRSIDEI
ncbi:phosphoribosyl-AMP cyclohydrolase [uncultured Clostridium sp.]|uniref:phosphoribosyl-AMP cyclohydrolase n=1 Tax=uncultured Clostridium sp. TaxID=59620 RepID=UPI002584B4A1|nr:phosphoribosyl-AMP cyclohydrolase [uncultured Clostridium sp.]